MKTSNHILRATKREYCLIGNRVGRPLNCSDENMQSSRFLFCISISKFAYLDI